MHSKIHKPKLSPSGRKVNTGEEKRMNNHVNNGPLSSVLMAHALYLDQLNALIHFIYSQESQMFPGTFKNQVMHKSLY